jgi:hypothetical protein
VLNIRIDCKPQDHLVLFFGPLAGINNKKGTKQTKTTNKRGFKNRRTTNYGGQQKTSTGAYINGQQTYKEHLT